MEYNVKRTMQPEKYLVLLSIMLLLNFSCSKEGDDNIVFDIDGNVYHTIAIGNQVWMVENLRTTKYNDSSAITLVTDNTAWVNLKTPAYCWYNNDSLRYKETCGALYNWYAVNTERLCPKGWHVASDSDWKELEITLGMTQVAADSLFWRGTDQGTKLKSMNGWYKNGNGTNSSGFNAIPAGIRDWDDGLFYWIDTYSHWWTSTEEYFGNAWDRDVHYDHSQVFRYPNNKNYGMSVRCVKD